LASASAAALALLASSTVASTLASATNAILYTIINDNITKMIN